MPLKYVSNKNRVYFCLFGISCRKNSRFGKISSTGTTWRRPVQRWAARRRVSLVFYSLPVRTARKRRSVGAIRALWAVRRGFYRPAFVSTWGTSMWRLRWRIARFSTVPKRCRTLWPVRRSVWTTFGPIRTLFSRKCSFFFQQLV